jgi:hypothetical protein
MSDATLSPNYDASSLETNHDVAPSLAPNYDNDTTTAVVEAAPYEASYEASYPVADEGNNETSKASYLEARKILGAYDASETDVSKVQWN